MNSHNVNVLINVLTYSMSIPGPGKLAHDKLLNEAKSNKTIATDYPCDTDAHNDSQAFSFSVSNSINVVNPAISIDIPFHRLVENTLHTKSP